VLKGGQQRENTSVFLKRNEPGRHAKKKQADKFKRSSSSFVGGKKRAKGARADKRKPRKPTADEENGGS